MSLRALHGHDERRGNRVRLLSRCAATLSTHPFPARWLREGPRGPGAAPPGGAIFCLRAVCKPKWMRTSVPQTRSQRARNRRQEVPAEGQTWSPLVSQHMVGDGQDAGCAHARTHAHARTTSLTYRFPVRGVCAGPAGLSGRHEVDAGLWGVAAAQASDAAGGASGNGLKEEGAALESGDAASGVESCSRPLRAYTAAPSLKPCARARRTPLTRLLTEKPALASRASRGRGSFSSLKPQRTEVTNYK